MMGYALALVLNESQAKIERLLSDGFIQFILNLAWTRFFRHTSDRYCLGNHCIDGLSDWLND